MYSAIHVPDISVEAILRHQPELRSKAVVIIDGTPPILRVIGLNLRARRLGITCGMNKLEAEQFPEAVIRQRSQAQESSALAALMDCAGAVSPRVEETARDTVVLDIDGLERLFGSYSDIARELSRQISQTGLSANVAIAANPDTAVLAARGNAGTTVIDPGTETERLRVLSIDILQLDAETHETLSRWGIPTLGALAKLPARALSERLGQNGVRLHRLARGAEMRPLALRSPRLHFEEAMDLDDAIHTLEPLAFILSRLLDRLFQRLRSRGLATSELHLDLQRERPHDSCTRALRTPLPVQNPRIVTRLLLLDLEAHPPGAPVVGVRIVAVPARPRIVQNGLFVPLSPEPEKFELTLARLGALVGEGNVGSPEIEDSHARDRFRMGRLGRSVKDATAHNEQDARKTIKAFRLFRPPIEATVRMRNGLPCWIAFSGLHGAIPTASGPWRGSGDWWNGRRWEREEWDVETISDSDPGNPNARVLRIFKDVSTGKWYAEGIYD